MNISDFCRFLNSFVSLKLAVCFECLHGAADKRGSGSHKCTQAEDEK